ncbi:SPOR domain-containing protein [Rubrivirga sp.]|uniref:SPOR domain-containing protein n=1 Tax=Rubrivirga sp. TaxID=1885344 RepID=UPI003B528C28
MRFSSLVAVVAALSLSACSGLGPAAPDPGPDVPETPEATYPAYETFDPSGLDAEPPASTTIVHDVPADVMAGRVRVPDQGGAPAPPPQEPVAQQVEGFRVQIFSSASRDAAERVRGEAARWWQRSGGSGSMEAMVVYLQPYYRVRMGGFATREEAEAALALVRREYPEAFLVPDVVTVMR